MLNGLYRLEGQQHEVMRDSRWVAKQQPSHALGNMSADRSVYVFALHADLKVPFVLKQFVYP